MASSRTRRRLAVASVIGIAVTIFPSGMADAAVQATLPSVRYQYLALQRPPESGGCIRHYFNYQNIGQRSLAIVRVSLLAGNGVTIDSDADYGIDPGSSGTLDMNLCSFKFDGQPGPFKLEFVAEKYSGEGVNERGTLDAFGGGTSTPTPTTYPPSSTFPPLVAAPTTTVPPVTTSPSTSTTVLSLATPPSTMTVAATAPSIPEQGTMVSVITCTKKPYTFQVVGTRCPPGYVKASTVRRARLL